MKSNYEMPTISVVTFADVIVTSDFKEKGETEIGSGSGKGGGMD